MKRLCLLSSGSFVVFTLLAGCLSACSSDVPPSPPGGGGSSAWHTRRGWGCGRQRWRRFFARAAARVPATATAAVRTAARAPPARSGSANGGGSVGGSGQAGALASAGAAGGPSGSAGAPANAILSADFESDAVGKQPAGWHNFIAYNTDAMNPQGDLQAIVDATRPHGGNNSLHVKGGQSPVFLTRPLPTGAASCTCAATST